MQSNGTYKIAVLSDGREVKIEIERVRQIIKTRHDTKRFTNLKDDDYDHAVAEFTGLTFEEIDAMSIEDFQKVDRALSEAIQERLSPNSR